MEKIRVVLCDVDFAIYYPGMWLGAISKMCVDRGYQPDFTEFITDPRVRVGVLDWIIYQLIRVRQVDQYAPPWAGAVGEMMHVARVISRDFDQPALSADLVRRARLRGLEFAIVSNRPRQLINCDNRLLSAIGKHPAVILGRDEFSALDFNHHTIRIEAQLQRAIEMARSRHNVAVEQIAYCGISVGELIAARELGLQTVGILSWAPNEARVLSALQATGARYVCSMPQFIWQLL